MEQVAQPPRDPLELFSAEVWALIMQKVEDPNDLWSMLNAHPVLRGIWKGNESAWNATLFSVALPQLQGRLSVQDWLNLRKVSRSVKNAVDEHVESGKLPFKANGGCFCCRDLSFDIRSEQACTQVLTKLREYPMAKLVGGSVKVNITTDFFHGNWSVFFEEHGGKVVDLIINMHREGACLNPLHMLDCLHFILERTPRLKKLSVYFRGIWRVCVSYRTWDDRVVAQRLLEMPFPNLPYLTFALLQKTFGMQLEPGTQGIIRGILDAYKHQIQCLVLQDVETPPPEEMGAMTNLYLWTYDENLQESLGGLQAPLCKLSINNRRGIEMTEFFRLVDRFRNTLKNIIVSYIRNDHGVPSAVQLPFLESLRLDNFCITSWAAFNFLLNCPRLREVDIEFLIRTNIRTGLDKMLPGVILLEPYFKENGSLDQTRFKESPIWQRLLSLQSVKIVKLNYPSNRAFPQIKVHSRRF